MRITVLGASAVRPNAGGACAGYLLETGEGRYLIDCGAGVVGRLREHLSLADLDGVFLSHAHPDHCSDAVFLRQALCYAPDNLRAPDHPLPIYASAETIDTLLALGTVFDFGRGASEGGHVQREGCHGYNFWQPTIDLRPIDPASTLNLPGLDVTFAVTEHFIPCLAMRFEDRDQVVFTYGADTGPCHAVTELARNAHLLLIEATLPSRVSYEDQTGHIAPAEIGLLARDAGVRRVLLTHYFDAHDLSAMVADVAEICGCEVSLAREGSTYVVGKR